MRAALLLACLVAGCDAGTSAAGPAPDAAPPVPDAATSPASDAAAPPADAAAPDAVVTLTCACAPDERCRACFELIGRCCYDDPTAYGQVGQLAANCEADPRCRACCDECAARDCAEVRATNDCPVPVTE